MKIVSQMGNTLARSVSGVGSLEAFLTLISLTFTLYVQADLTGKLLATVICRNIT